jgi:hypothetical protein
VNEISLVTQRLWQRLWQRHELILICLQLLQNDGLTACAFLKWASFENFCVTKAQMLPKWSNLLRAFAPCKKDWGEDILKADGKQHMLVSAAAKTDIDRFNLWLTQLLILNLIITIFVEQQETWIPVQKWHIFTRFYRQNFALHLHLPHTHSHTLTHTLYTYIFLVLCLCKMISLSLLCFTTIITTRTNDWVIIQAIRSQDCDFPRRTCLLAIITDTWWHFSSKCIAMKYCPGFKKSEERDKRLWINWSKNHS